MGLFGYSARLKTAGSVPSAQVIALLLADPAQWKNNHIGLIDDIEDDFVEEYGKCTDITVDAELLFINTNGLNCFEDEIHSNTTLFFILSSYAEILQHTEATRFLNSQFGMHKWQKKYKSINPGIFEHNRVELILKYQQRMYG